MSNDKINFSELKRVLIIKLRHHGDVLLSSPVFQVLKNHYPHLEIDGLVYKETAEMLQFHPAVSKLHCIDRDWKKQGKIYSLGKELKLLNTLKRRQYDLIIHLTEHWRGASLVRLLRPEYSISADYQHRRGTFWRKTFTHLYTPGHYHIVERNLDALRAMEITPQDDEKQLVLEPGPAARDKIKRLLESESLAAQGFIHIHPGSRWLFKCWKESHFSAFIKTLIGRGEKVVVTAAPDKAEMDMVGHIIQGIKTGLLDLGGNLNLLELAALTSQAKCYIGVDTAPTHIAAAMQTPLVVLFGPSDETLWGPWQVKHRVISGDGFNCRPCNQDGCKGSKISDCLYEITADTVLKAMDEMMSDMDTDRSVS
ncbi:MAG TPA: putative lipopolysaccharide heptosyltransferase III [Gammaproteobacteria bacterium]|nr:putative lipopolysaccharide heptosyltransferase III [Gammaproteobacteria bacterium]